MWMEHYARAESEDAFWAAIPAEWRVDEEGIVGAEGVVMDVIGTVGEWFLVNLRVVGALPEALGGMVIERPAFPRRVFA